MAIIELKASQALSEEAVIGHWRDVMAHFKASKRVIFVESLPKNSSGKVLKRDLRMRYADVLSEVVESV